MGGCLGCEGCAATTTEVAVLLRLKVSAVDRLAGLGMLPGTCFGKEWRFDLRTVRAHTIGSGKTIRLKIQPKNKPS